MPPTSSVWGVGAFTDFKLQQRTESCLPSSIFNEAQSIYAPMNPNILLAAFLCFSSFIFRFSRYKIFFLSHNQPFHFTNFILIFILFWLDLKIGFTHKKKLLPIIHHRNEISSIIVFFPNHPNQGPKTIKLSSKLIFLSFILRNKSIFISFFYWKSSTKLKKTLFDFYT